MVTFWFVVVAFFWVGFFVLEGFDFGVGVLHSVVGRTEEEQRVAVNTIGPFWDGNEVWLVVVGGLTFAAFPQWYATMFSSFYLVMVLILVSLMGRGVAFEYRAKVSDRRWTRGWRWSLTVGSALVPVLIGIALGDLLAGLPIDGARQFTGSFFDLLRPYGLWMGITLLALSLLSGATFLTIKTTGVVQARAARLAPRIGWAASALVVGFVVWTEVVGARQVVPSFLDAVVVLSTVGAAWGSGRQADGWAFTAALLAMATSVALLFVSLHPHVMVSSTSAADSLTAVGAASPPYSLKVMTVVAVIVTPFVLAYQAWNYWVFRQRLASPSSDGTSPVGGPTAPLASAGDETAGG